jgi:hypothetical protein
MSVFFEILGREDSEGAKYSVFVTIGEFAG